ncbi:PREDICTED: uncharacterized protein LOC107191934 isoform X1 [Dufourea novaeangliae]|uniref:uncharacterized protein LOC107191934 isoform X1 n=1 Tax=Dufourea novaeangliae TaxID=178035 RepID=UPI000767343F|nr:PREDICTED: uncharacterized protein LOC107191934 isoform X1 [Dufourea novaeangliae]
MDASQAMCAEDLIHRILWKGLLKKLTENTSIETERPKRAGDKTCRNETTSSDEESNKRIKVNPGNVAGDTEELWHNLEENAAPLNTYTCDENAEQHSFRTQPDASSEPMNSDYRDLYQKMENLEAISIKNNMLLEKIFKQLQQQRGIPSKPTILPICTVDGMTEFNNIDEDTYKDVVNYFEFVGGFSLKEAVNLCFKEAIDDQLTMSYSWLGREEGNKALCETRIVRAIHDAVLHNRHFTRPSKKEVAVILKMALRTSKERVRSRRASRNQSKGGHFRTAEEERERKMQLKQEEFADQEGRGIREEFDEEGF